ncbi:MAG: hypothetical protein ABJP79_10770 [Tateyamaria sp.]|uniref:hypothetical protein n=1 Tax=Tateyamaria sp. TaxID=1929288 RepID=UPI00329ADECE
MSKRFENGYIALFLTCVVMLFIVGFVSWNVMYSKGYQAADKDHQSAYATHQAAEEHYRKCVAEETVEDALGCYKDAYNTDREQERAEADLNAQREMANWAEGMLWATLFIGTVTAAVTALGVIYVAKTLGATSETLKAARAANKIMRDDQRPWLKVHEPTLTSIKALPGGFHGGNASVWIEFSVSIENVGKSPAHQVSIYRNYREGREKFIESDEAARSAIGTGDGKNVILPTETKIVRMNGVVDVDMPPTGTKHTLDLWVSVGVAYKIGSDDESKVTWRRFMLNQRQAGSYNGATLCAPDLTDIDAGIADIEFAAFLSEAT